MIKMFTAEWCASCKGIKKKLELMQVDVEYVDIDKQPDEARELGVRGIPYLYNTETKQSLIGNVSVDQLKKFFS